MDHHYHRACSLALAAAAAIATPAVARTQGTPYLVADLTTAPAAPVLQVDAGAVAGTFSVAFRTYGTDLGVWRTDGTTAGTVLLRSLPKVATSFQAPVARNGFVFFKGPSDDGLDMLWVSDGTTAGTVAIGGAGRRPHSLAVDLTLTTTRVWFSASDATNGRELWRSDGTAAGTVRVTQLRAGAADGMPASERVIAPLSSGVFIAGENSTSGVELFRIVGGFHVLYANLAAGSASSNPRGFAWSGDYLMFAADGTGGTEPYCLAQNVLQTIDVYPGPAGSLSGSPIVVYQPTLTQPFFYFGAAGNTGNGEELWRYNPFSQGLTEIDVVPGPTSSWPRPLFSLGTRVVCEHGQPLPLSPRTLFTVNGGGTTVTTLMNTFFAAVVASTSPTHMAIRVDSGVDAGLYRSDGTAAGTILIDASGGGLPAALLPAGSGCLLSDGRRMGTTGTPNPLLLPNPPLNDGSAMQVVATLGDATVLFTKDEELWRSDGTAAGTTSLLPGPNPPKLWLMGPKYLDQHWFVMKTPVTGTTFLFALYKTDGTPGGTMHVGDLTTSLGVFQPGFAITGNRLLVPSPFGFTFQLYATDGTTVQLLATNAFTPTTMGGYALFASANNPSIGSELWRTDGTPGGTLLVSDINPGAGSGMQGDILPLNATTALFLGDGGSGDQIWRTNGTPSMTSAVTTFAASPFPSLDLLAATGTGRVLFAATTGNGRDLWSTNGTAAGTVLLVDDAGNQPKLLGKCNGAWLFTNRGPGLHDYGRLYKTNGTVATTTLVATLPAGSISDADENALLDGYAGNPEARLFRVGNVMFRTDGTTTGTIAFGPVPTLPWDSRRNQLAPQGADVAVFEGGDAGGFELWRSGLATTTVKHAELNPGPASSSPRDFVHSGGLVFFTADDGQHGRELWAMPAMPTVISYGAACPGTGGRVPSLVATSPPRLGGVFATELQDGLVSSIALRSLGFSGLAIPIGGGCNLLNDAIVTDAFVLDALGVGTPPPTAIPLTAALVGVSVFAQGAVLDPAGAFGALLSMTAGLQAIVGP